jgi:hypothetical protein
VTHELLQEVADEMEIEVEQYLLERKAAVAALQKVAVCVCVCVAARRQVGLLLGRRASRCPVFGGGGGFGICDGQYDFVQQPHLQMH